MSIVGEISSFHSKPTLSLKACNGLVTTPITIPMFSGPANDTHTVNNLPLRVVS